MFPLAGGRSKEEEERGGGKEKLSNGGKKQFPFYILLVGITSILWFFVSFRCENETPNLNDL